LLGTKGYVVVVVILWLVNALNNLKMDGKE
jgi:hypothetical protein